MKMYIAGRWVSASKQQAVISPYTGRQVDEVPLADDVQVEESLRAATDGAKVMGALPAHERFEIVSRAASLVDQNLEDLAQTVSLEEGKPIGEARVEVGRCVSLLQLAAFEGTQIRGETFPITAQKGAEGKMGMTFRVPCGVVVAITPFNFPLMLVAHKLGPALAAGNAVILKPAGNTPLSGLKLTEIFLEAGIPELGLQCLTGLGSKIGPVLSADSRVRKISFTGSAEVGLAITKMAGVKKLSLELGSNSPLIVMPDANLEAVVAATVVGGFANAGQVCISTQRVLVDQKIYGDFLDATKQQVEAIKIGDPLQEDTKLSAMISLDDAQRVEHWIGEAVGGGARVVTGGGRDGAVVEPTIIADVDPRMRVSCDELFGPAIAVTPVTTINEAIFLANDTQYGLGAGVFTQNLNHAMRFAREIESGSVMINWSPQWRADMMPYGGFKQSGIGKEGPRYAVEEMTEIKSVVFHGLDE